MTTTFTGVALHPHPDPRKREGSKPSWCMEHTTAHQAGNRPQQRDPTQNQVGHYTTFLHPHIRMHTSTRISNTKLLSNPLLSPLNNTLETVHNAPKAHILITLYNFRKLLTQNYSPSKYPQNFHFPISILS